MSFSPIHVTNSSTTCDCDKDVRSACKDLPSYKEYEGKRYCVLHYPGKDKSTDFNKALKRKLDAQDFDFRGVWFPEHLPLTEDFSRRAYFSHATFNEGASFIGAKFLKADFNNAIFNGLANFHRSNFDVKANFFGAEFKSETNFAYVHFNVGVDFSSAVFREKVIFAYAEFHVGEAIFEEVKFEGEANFDAAHFAVPANFQEAVFNAEAHFIKTTFGVSADFRKATFRDFVQFEGTEEEEMFRKTHPDQPWFSVQPFLDLRSVKIAPLQRITFDNLTLRPHWFVKVNADSLIFSNVRWDFRNIRAEIKSLKNLGVPTPREALGIAYRQLADNAEGSHLYEIASKFRFMAMEARRLEAWKGFAPWRLSWWYWLASGYSERVWRAFLVLLGVWLLFAVLYTQVGFSRWEPRVSNEQDAAAARRDDTGAPLSPSRTLSYSLAVMLLQKPEPRPATNTANALVMLETILGPLQAALLALAIRRKFMR